MTILLWCIIAMIFSEFVVGGFSFAANYSVATILKRYRSVAKTPLSDAFTPAESEEITKVKRVMQEINDGQYPEISKEQLWVDRYHVPLYLGFVFIVSFIFFFGLSLIFIPSEYYEQFQLTLQILGGIVFALLSLGIIFFLKREYRAFVAFSKLMQKNGFNDATKTIQQITRRLVIEGCGAELMLISSLGVVISTFSMNY